MISNFLKMIFGSSNDRELKRMGKAVKKINAFSDEIKTLSDEQLAGKKYIHPLLEEVPFQKELAKQSDTVHTIIL